MYIKSLALNNFRNYEEAHIEFSKGINILYGDNAQGKTNVLEAAYMTATTKSHRGSFDKEIIRFGMDEAHIRADVNRNDIDHRIDMHLRKNKNKGVAIDMLPLKKSAELFGMINIIFFSPEDLTIIKNGPAERRRFMDMELCQLDKI
jgi:DNA replication and repair protein RecF